MQAQTQQLDLSFQKSELANGLRVITSHMPYTRSVSTTVLVGVGSRNETPERSGVSHFVEHLLFKGTERRPTPEEISGTVEGVGGILNAGTEQELTAYWCKVAKPAAEGCIDLLIDMLRNSLYDPGEVERERSVLLEEQNMVKDSPSYRVETLIEGMLWPDHPLGWDVAGTRESVSKITREMILEHVADFYVPSNIVVSVAGDVNHDEIMGQIDGLCAGWDTQIAPASQRFTDNQQAPKLKIQNRRTEQSHISIALPGLPMTDPELYALDLLSVALGEGMSSRLFVEIREKRGLAYDIHSTVAYFADCGAFFINAGVDPKKVYVAVDTILTEISRLKEGVTSEELERAKQLATGRMLLRMEDTRAVSSWFASQEMLLGHVHKMDEVVGNIESVTAEQILSLANRLLKTEKLNMAVVGPHRGETRFQRSLQLGP